MGLSAVAAKVMTPTIYLSNSLPAFNLDKSIPSRFDDWQEEKNFGPEIVNPQSLQLVNKIYTQTLSRTYVNNKGERIMLSVAYGADQRDGFQLHHPEVCYPAQGFQVQLNETHILKTGFSSIPVKRLMTKLGSRSEPVTYWTTVGTKVVQGGKDTKIAQIGYGIKGHIPDGLLFRISSITSDATSGYASHEAFARQLIAVLPAESRTRLIGNHQ